MLYKHFLLLNNVLILIKQKFPKPFTVLNNINMLYKHFLLLKNVFILILIISMLIEQW